MQEGVTCLLLTDSGLIRESLLYIFPAEVSKLDGYATPTPPLPTYTVNSILLTVHSGNFTPPPCQQEPTSKRGREGEFVAKTSMNMGGDDSNPSPTHSGGKIIPSPLLRCWYTLILETRFDRGHVNVVPVRNTFEPSPPNQGTVKRYPLKHNYNLCSIQGSQ